MTRGSAQPDRTTGPSHKSVVANSIEEMEAIKASRRKQMNKFDARGTTDILSLIPPEVALRGSVLSEIKRDAACQGDGYAPLPARGVVLATAQTGIFSRPSLKDQEGSF